MGLNRCQWCTAQLPEGQHVCGLWCDLKANQPASANLLPGSPHGYRQLRAGSTETGATPQADSARSPQALALWAALRRAVLARDFYRCFVCRAVLPAHRLNAHHLVPRADGGTDEMRNLVTLCVPHHDEVEGLAWDGLCAARQAHLEAQHG